MVVTSKYLIGLGGLAALAAGGWMYGVFDKSAPEEELQVFEIVCPGPLFTSEDSASPFSWDDHDTCREDEQQRQRWRELYENADEILPTDDPAELVDHLVYGRTAGSDSRVAFIKLYRDHNRDSAAVIAALDILESDEVDTIFTANLVQLLRFLVQVRWDLMPEDLRSRTAVVMDDIGTEGPNELLNTTQDAHDAIDAIQSSLNQS